MQRILWLWGVLSFWLLSSHSLWAQSKWEECERKALETTVVYCLDTHLITPQHKETIESINREYLTSVIEVEKSDRSRWWKMKKLCSLNKQRERELRKLLGGKTYGEYRDIEKEVRLTQKDENKSVDFLKNNLFIENN
ncbi:hypothetical protein [Sphingobacterium sp. T2]|uniref:hypothetical protein n=1 Tax=Sphingobacterium sp. T2 TaxID=1590596 RepID=UPI00057B82BA|nr:hypothetical protein [Sphingobacterium sp. T2]